MCVCVPNDLRKTEREIVTKYQDLKNALIVTWNLNSIEVIPVIIGATGVMKDNSKDILIPSLANPRNMKCK